jgi:ABC-type oligopeptide transport system substrate-binding subunit
MLALLGLCLAAFALRSARPRADFAFTGGGELRSLDPHAVTGVPEGRVMRLLYEGLVGRNPATLAAEPGVAESWKSSPDGKTLTFTLRADARWSNGDPLTAHDFEWSFRRILEPSTACEYASSLWVIEGAHEFTTGQRADGSSCERDWSKVGIKARDDRTLELRLAQPTPHFFALLSLHVFVPVHRASLEALMAEHPQTWATRWTRPGVLVSNGPFRLSERRIGEVLRFERNEQYWDARNVAMRTVDVLSVESWTSALNLYLAGELDWVDGAIPTSLVPELLGREDFEPRPYLGVRARDEPAAQRALSARTQGRPATRAELRAAAHRRLSPTEDLWRESGVRSQVARRRGAGGRKGDGKAAPAGAALQHERSPPRHRRGRGRAVAQGARPRRAPP